MNNYDDIINCEHYVSKTRKPMSLMNRSSQFAPFSALTGYSEAIKEASRLTDKKIELSDELIDRINLKLQIIKNNIKDKPLIKITYFIKDNKKSGGHYKTIEKNIYKIDNIHEKIIFIDKEEININDILNIESTLIDFD